MSTFQIEYLFHNIKYKIISITCLMLDKTGAIVLKNHVRFKFHNYINSDLFKVKGDIPWI